MVKCSMCHRDAIVEGRCLVHQEEAGTIFQPYCIVHQSSFMVDPRCCWEFRFFKQEEKPNESQT